MGDVTDKIDFAFRDFNTDGVPSSGDYEVVKSIVRAIGPAIETAMGAAVAGFRSYATVADRDADNTAPVGTIGYVYNNGGSSSDTANGFYQRISSGWESADWLGGLIQGQLAQLSAAIALIGAALGSSDLYGLKSGAVYPLQVDASGNVTIGIDANGNIVARFDSAAASKFSLDLRASLGNDQYDTLALKSGSAYPVLVDANGNVVVGVDSSGKILARFDPLAGSMFSQDLRSSLGSDLYDTMALKSLATGSVIPLTVGADGKVVVGIDPTTGQLVANFPASSGSATVVHAAPIPLASADRITLLSTTSISAITAGQSLSDGIVDAAAAALSTVQPWANVGFSDGPHHNPVNGGGSLGTRVALVEHEDDPNNRSETVVSGMANFATELALRDNAAVIANTVFFGASAGVGGTGIASWLPTAAPASGQSQNWFNRMIGIYQDAFNLESAAGRQLVVPAINWLQGENDASTMSKADYKTNLQTIRTAAETAIKAITGQTTPVAMILYQTSSNSLKSSTGQGNIAQAQFELCRDVANFYHGTMIGFMPQVAVGNLHLTPLGYLWTGKYFGRKLKQLAIDGVKPQWLYPVSAIAKTEGSLVKLRVKFNVPWKPLVIDVLGLPSDITNYGIAVADATGSLTLSGIAVENGDTVVMTLNRALGSTPTVRFAMDYRSASATSLNGGQSNLRDSCPDSFPYGGVTYSLANLCPHCETPITVYTGA